MTEMARAIGLAQQRRNGRCHFRNTPTYIDRHRKQTSATALRMASKCPSKPTKFGDKGRFSRQTVTGSVITRLTDQIRPQGGFYAGSRLPYRSRWSRSKKSYLPPLRHFTGFFASKSNLKLIFIPYFDRECVRFDAAVPSNSGQFASTWPLFPNKP